MQSNGTNLSQNDIRTIEDIISRGADVEIRKRPQTGGILIFEVKKKIKCGK